MSKTRRIPAYVHHKATGQARVRINGRDHYLGKYGSPESHERYDELVAEFLDGGQKSSTTLTTVLAAWWPECKRRYGNRGKGQYGNAVCWRPVIRLLREAHGDERADDLGPVKLRAIIEAETKKRDWSSRYAKMILSRAKYIFKWAVSEELVSLATYQRLETVELRDGRKPTKVLSVDIKVLARTLRCLPSKIAAMVRIQRLTGMRPGELVTMRAHDINRSGDVWIYVPQSHKTEHHGKERSIYIGPKAQCILTPFLLKAGDGYVFRSKGDRCYTSDSYRRAIQRVCQKHGIPSWSPHQLRKTAATKIRAALDIESAASVLGHSSARVTGDHYAAADQKRAIDAIRKLG